MQIVRELTAFQEFKVIVIFVPLIFTLLPFEETGAL